MNKSKNKWNIECISKNDYLHFREFYLKHLFLRGKNLIIFGSGILGQQFGRSLELYGLSEFVFLDNDKDKTGTYIGGHLVLSMSEVKQHWKMHQDLIVVAVEQNTEILEQLLAEGFKQNQDFISLTWNRDARILSSLAAVGECQILLLGDCLPSNISIREKGADSIAEMLHKRLGDAFCEICMNGFFTTTYYQILKQIIHRTKKIKKVVIFISIETFSSSYAFLPQVQPTELFAQIIKMPDAFYDMEVESFMENCKNRQKLLPVSGAYPNRSAKNKMQMEQSLRNHTRVNYMFRPAESSESVQMLNKIIALGMQEKMQMLFIIPPINYELAEQYCGEEFRVRYNNICAFIADKIRNARLLDLSYLLSKENFISIASIGEGIYEQGREEIVKQIIKYL